MNDFPAPLVLERVLAGKLFLRLFTPTGQEASFRGYLPVTLTAADWQLLPGGGAVCRMQRFQSTIDQRQDLAGWMLEDEHGRPWAGEKFEDGPYRIHAAGDGVEVEITLGA